MDKKKKSTLFTRLFGNRNKVTDFMTEEQLQSPGRLILKNFLHNRLGMIGLIVFLLIFLLVMIGPKFYTLDLSYQDNTQLNVPPGMNMMSIPDGMKHKVADISPGTTYGLSLIHISCTTAALRRRLPASCLSLCWSTSVKQKRNAGNCGRGNKRRKGAALCFTVKTVIC